MATSVYSLLKKKADPGFNLGIAGLDDADPAVPDSMPEVTAAANAIPTPKPVIPAGPPMLNVAPVAKGSGLTNTKSHQKSDTDQSTDFDTDQLLNSDTNQTLNSDTKSQLNSLLNSRQNSNSQMNQNLNMTGGKTDNKTEEDSSTKDGTTDLSKMGQTRNVYDGKTFNDNLDLIMGSKPVQGQLEDINALKALMAQLTERKAQVNLSPLMNIANYLTKGQSGQYELPPEVSDKEKILLAQADKLIKDKRDIANEAIKNTQQLKVGANSDMQSQALTQMILNSNKTIQAQEEFNKNQAIQQALQKQATATQNKTQNSDVIKNQDINTNKVQDTSTQGTKDVNTQAIIDKQIAEAKDPTVAAKGNPAALDFRKAKAAADLVLKDPILKQGLDQATQAESIAQDIESGNPAARNNVPIRLGKLVTGGVRTLVDVVHKEGGDTSLLEKLAQHGETLMRGDLTVQNQKEYIDFLHDFGSLVQKTMADRSKYLRGVLKVNYDQPDEKIDSLLNAGLTQTHKTPAASGAKYEGRYQQAAPSGGGASGFPRTVMGTGKNAGKQATVKNANELKDAQDKGWK